MHDTHSDQRLLECPECESRIYILDNNVLRLNCPMCGKEITPVNRRNRAPGVLISILTASAWGLAVLPWVGRDGSAELTFVVTFAAWLALMTVVRRWKPVGVNSVKLVESGKRTMGIMLAASVPFALLALYLRLPGDSSTADWTIGRLLELQALSTEWRAVTTVKAAGQWLLLGAIALGLGFILLNVPSGLTATLRFRKAASKFLSMVSIAIIAIGSFSIIVGSGAAAPVHMANEQIAQALRSASQSLARIENEARIVAGEQLVAALLDAEPQADAHVSESSEAEDLYAEIIRWEAHLEGLRSGALLPSDPEPELPPFGDEPETKEFDQIIADIRQSMPRASTLPNPRLANYAAFTTSRIAFVDTHLLQGGQRPSAQSFTQATIRETVELIVDLAMDSTGAKIPSLQVQRPFGAFFSKIVETLTAKPANDALKASVANVATDMLRGKAQTGAGIANLAAPVRPTLIGLKGYLADRLQAAKRSIEAIQSADRPAEKGPDPPKRCMCQWIRGGIPQGPPFPCACSGRGQ